MTEIVTDTNTQENAAPALDIDTAATADPFPADEERPCYRIYREPIDRMGRKYRKGVYYHALTTPKGDSPAMPIDDYICDPLTVLADTKDPNGQNYGKLLEFETKDRSQTKRLLVPMDMILNDRSGELISVLGNEGLYIDFRNGRRYLNAFVNSQSPEGPYLQAARSTGWHGAAFVFPDEVIGADDVWFQSRERIAAYSTAGTLEGWKGHISDMASGNPLLQLSLCAALAGTLLHRMNIHGGGLHFYGASSQGKTTSLYAASSVWGNGNTYYQAWNATANSLEGTARLYTDTLLGLDEIHSCRPRDLDMALYGLANGVGKGRANERGDPRNVARWRVFFISNGELSIPAALARDNIRLMAGQSVRLLDIYATGEKYGFFSDLHDANNAAAFADALRDAAATHYGHAGKAFVRYLISLEDTDISGLAQAIQNDLAPMVVSEQERRAARLFAVCALAGELAIEAGILTWSVGEAIAAAKHGFNLWLTQRATHGRNQEDMTIYSNILAFIETHGGSRFEDIGGGGRPVINRAGWKRADQDDETVYMFTSTGLQEAAGVRDIRQVTKALAGIDGFIETDTGQHNKMTRVGNDTLRLYRVDIAKLEGLTDE